MVYRNTQYQRLFWTLGCKKKRRVSLFEFFLCILSLPLCSHNVFALVRVAILLSYSSSALSMKCKITQAGNSHCTFFLGGGGGSYSVLFFARVFFIKAAFYLTCTCWSKFSLQYDFNLTKNFTAQIVVV